MQTKWAEIVHLYSALSWVSKFYILESYCISGGGIGGVGHSQTVWACMHLYFLNSISGGK